jgi:hypothetical protein
MDEEDDEIAHLSILARRLTPRNCALPVIRHRHQSKHIKPSGLEPEMEVAVLLGTILKVNLSEWPENCRYKGIHPSRRRNVS